MLIVESYLNNSYITGSLLVLQQFGLAVGSLAFLGPGPIGTAVPGYERAQRHETVPKVNISYAGSILGDSRTFLLYRAIPKTLGTATAGTATFL